MCGDSVNAYCKFQLRDEEALYGLGQFRDNLMNLRNAKRELVQFNTQAAVPVIYSTVVGDCFGIILPGLFIQTIVPV